MHGRLHITSQANEAPPRGMECNFNTVNTVSIQSGAHSNEIALFMYLTIDL